MNRRSFLTRLGVAAIGAAALSIDDPEALLWIPGAKTIIDFGATKQVLPATDAEVTQQFRGVLMQPPLGRQAMQGSRDQLDGPRDITLTIGSTSFRYRDETLVSLHSEAEMKLLDTPMFGSAIGRETSWKRNPRVLADFSFIDID